MEPIEAPRKHPSTDYIEVYRVSDKQWGWTRYSEDGNQVSASGVEHKTRKAADAEARELNPTIDDIRERR